MQTKIKITGNDWVNKIVTIKDRTKVTLKNGKIIPTDLASFRMVAKV